jgi:replicative DNA helicase
VRFSEIMENPDRAIKRLDTHLMRALFNNFVVIEAPTFSMTTSQLDANIESHALQGTVPDIVFVDYADIMLPQRSYRERWLEIETSYMELRAIAMKRNLVMVTASQINREGADARQIKLEHVKGAYGKTHNADVVISLNRSIEDKFRSNLIRLYINKNRNNIADREILLSVDYETMSFSEVQGQVPSSNALV